MKIAISSGHARHVSGAVSLIREVDEARRVVERVAEYLRTAAVEVVVIHDDVSKTQTANLSWLVTQHNKHTRDLDVSIHFNSTEGGVMTRPIGTEVLYATQEALAKKISAAISKASGLINRVPVHRPGLTFLSRTKMPAVLIEVAFVNSRADVALFEQHFDAICKAIAEALSGRTIGAASSSPGPSTPAPTAPTALLVLRRGDKGEDVGELQQLLNDKNSAGLRVDKDFGPLTEAAVWSFLWSRLKP